jgi:hypothetical protein
VTAFWLTSTICGVLPSVLRCVSPWLHLHCAACTTVRRPPVALRKKVAARPPSSMGDDACSRGIQGVGLQRESRQQPAPPAHGRPPAPTILAAGHDSVESFAPRMILLGSGDSGGANELAPTRVSACWPASVALAA